MSDSGLLRRDEIPEKAKWNTASVYPSEEAWEEACARVNRSMSRLREYQGRLSEGAETLVEWFALFEELWQESEKIYLYASLFHNADTTDQEAATREGRGVGLYAQVATAAAFAEPELLQIDADALREWTEQEPRLAHYRHYFDQLLRRKPHVRSAEVEEVLSQLAEPFYLSNTVHGVLTDADLTFTPAISSNQTEHTVAQGTIDALMTHPDREIRRTAWESYADAHLAFRNTMANCLINCVKQHALLARVKRYDSCLESALAADNIPTDVFHSFIATFRKHLPTWHRYFRLRRKALGLDKLHVYDLKAPFSSSPPKVTYEQAVQWICEGMSPLGDEYVRVLRQGATAQRWVDARPNHGKRAGAFSTGCMGTNPFILMSFTDDVFSLSTLAHELGHSMHSYLAWQTQPFVYSEYSIFVAEVASNFNQALLRHSLLQSQSEQNFVIALLEEALANFYRYFFIMPTLARFELEIHQRIERGEGLNADSLNRLMRDLFAEGFGEEVVMDEDRTGITWAQFSTHLYANFYVYQYGTGISAAQALCDMVISGEEGAVERYLDFLRAGDSKYPIDALRDAGVDLSTAEPVDRAFHALARMIDRLEGVLSCPEKRGKQENIAPLADETGIATRGE